jgi:hypothetical protein
MVRSIVLLVVVTVFFAACTSVGERTGGSEEGGTNGAAVDFLTSDDRLGDPGADRASVGGLVFPVPNGWNLDRVAGDGTAVTGVIRSGSGEEVVVGSFPIGHEVTDGAFVLFIAHELFQFPAVSAEEYIQRFDDGSIYTSLPVETNGTAFRVRAFRDGTTVRFLASLFSDAPENEAAVTAILSGARRSRDGETVYRVRPGTIGFIETEQSEWLLLDDRNGGVTVAYVTDETEMVVSLQSDTNETGGTEPINLSENREPRDSVPVWIGTDRVMATAGERREDEWQVETYTVYAPVPLEITLSRRGATPAGPLLRSPEVDQLFRDNLWLGGEI